MAMGETGTRSETTFRDYLSKAYFDGLDGVRALCALGVITVHVTGHEAFGWLSGHLGVEVFFVLSGFLITTLSLREERARKEVSLKAFYIRRACRILPPYYVTLGVYCLLVFSGRWGQGPEKAGFFYSLASFLFYYQDIQAIKDGWTHPTHFGHSWSLAYEEKFYLLWPLLGFVILRGKPAFRFVVTTTLMVGLALAGRFAQLAGVSSSDSYLVVRIVSPYVNLLQGCILALLLDDEVSFNRLRIVAGMRGAVVTFLVFLVLWLGFPMFAPLLPEHNFVFGLGTVALLASIVIGRSPILPLLSLAPLSWIGRLSYGVYLVHPIGVSFVQKLTKPVSGDVPVVVFSYALCCVASIAIAYVMNATVERPLIRLGRTWSRRVLESVDAATSRARHFSIDGPAGSLPACVPIESDRAQGFAT
jgi:peptidoglycan/LPS O-acetylase OafA/YrhL